MSRKKLINLGFGDERRDINVSYYYYNFSLTLMLWIQTLIWSLSKSHGLAATLTGQRQVGALGSHGGWRRLFTRLGGSTSPFRMSQDLENWHRRRVPAILKREGRVLALQGASSCSKIKVMGLSRLRILGCSSCKRAKRI